MEDAILLYLDEQYGLIKRYKHKNNSQIIYNIIHAKVKYNVTDYKESLYLDSKKFINYYICSLEGEDYGYDEIQLVKIIDVANVLETKQKRIYLYNVQRLLQLKGYDIDALSNEIIETEIKVAKLDEKWFKYISLWISSSFCKLLLIYALYIVVVGLILLPAPFQWMELFDVKKSVFSNNSIINHFCNTIAFIIGNDSFSPEVIPNCFWGMVVYSLGVAFFYLVFVNYIFRKLEDYIKQK